MGVANITGNLLNDTGLSLSSYLPLTGGTLTGGLNGTSATFSSIVGVNGASEAGWSLKSNGNAKVEGTNGTTVLQVNDTSTGGKAWSLISAGAGNAHSVPAGTFYLRNSSDGITTLQIASTGAATFNIPRTSGTNVDIMTLSDNVTGIQTSGFGVRILATSNNGQAKSAIAFEADGGTNNDTAIAFYTQFSAASLDRRMTINRNGNVGIGKIPSNKALEIYQASDAALRIQNSTTGTGNNDGLLIEVGGSNVLFDNYESGYMAFATADTERMRITTSGVLAISTTGKNWESSYRALQIGDGWGMMAHDTNSDGYIISNAYYDGAWRISAQTNVRPSIFRVYDGLKLETGNSTGAIDTAVGTTNVFIVNISGNVTNLNNSYGGISDIKFKENIVDASPKLDDLLKVKVRNYNLKGNDKKQIGVIAQELEDIFPGLIEESNDTIKDENGENIETGEKTKSVKYSVFVPMLIKAIQELSAKVTALENK